MKVKDKKKGILSHLQQVPEGPAVIDVVNIEISDFELRKLQFGQVVQVLADEALGLEVELAKTARGHPVEVLLDSIDIDIQRFQH